MIAQAERTWAAPDSVISYNTEPTPECRKNTFDMTASVRMFRFDLETLEGKIHPETYQRVLDEELSLIVEGIGRAARTSFILKRGENGGLVYFKNGQWRSYDAMLEDGLEASLAEAEEDPRKDFKLDMARCDKIRGDSMKELKPGQKISWTSRYRHDKEAEYGEKFMIENGFNPERKLGFVYQATCLEDGHILLETQTLDLSDEDAFSAVEEAISSDPFADIDSLVELHDYTLSQKYEGETFHAGQRDFHENAWEWVNQQTGLMKLLISGLEDIARANLTGQALERTCQKHIYTIWAAFKKRLDGTAYRPEVMERVPGFALSASAEDWAVRQEVRWAYHDFTNRKEVMIGCGGSVTGAENEEDMLSLSPEDVFSSIFGRGKRSDETCSFTSKECPSCHRKNVKTNSVKEKGKTVYIGECGCRSDGKKSGYNRRHDKKGE